MPRVTTIDEPCEDCERNPERRPTSRPTVFEISAGQNVVCQQKKTRREEEGEEEAKKYRKSRIADASEINVNGPAALDGDQVSMMARRQIEKYGLDGRKKQRQDPGLSELGQDSNDTQQYPRRPNVPRQTVEEMLEQIKKERREERKEARKQARSARKAGRG